jgi:molybdopterin-containing oxidoreductase family iron-sulfur binding subunit
VSQVKHHVSGKQYWQSLQELSDSPEIQERLGKEFPGYDPKHIVSTTRRSFMKIMGASLALAGITLTGCRRWPKELLVPNSSQYKDRTPGVPDFYASVFELNGVGTGTLVSSYDGRPIKVEGNPDHAFARTVKNGAAHGIRFAQDSVNYGASDAFMQATVLELYDPDRSREVVERADNRTRSRSLDEFKSALLASVPASGEGFAILAETSSSLTLAAERKRLLEKFPQAKWYEYEPISYDNEVEGHRAVFGQALRARHWFDQAAVVVSLDCDFLGTHPAKLRYANDWSSRRRTADADRTMSRVYVFESTYSITGASADHRLPVKPSRIAAIASAIAAGLGVSGAAATSLSPEESKFVESVVKDLNDSKSNRAGVVLAGAQMPAEVHALVGAINLAIGAPGQTVTYHATPGLDRPTHAAAIQELARSITDGKVQSLLILGGNPVYNAPADLEFAKLLNAVSMTAHLSLYQDETSQLCRWHINKAHWLESWGDACAWDGTVSIAQPLIMPLYGGLSAIELLAHLAGDTETAGDKLVRRALGATAGTTEKAWKQALHDGVIPGTESHAVPVTPKAFSLPAPASSSGFEVRFLSDYKLFDGRFANLGWLQELPDPMTRVVWDNCAYISKRDADGLGVTTGDMIRVSVGGAALDIAAYVLPGQPIGVIGLTLGYGRVSAGNVSSGLGFDTYRLRTTSGMSFVDGVKVEKLGRKYTLVATTDHHLIDTVGTKGRLKRVGEVGGGGYIIREATLDHYKSDGGKAFEHGHGANLRLQLFDPPNSFNTPHAWGMAVDMNACIGCNACVVACQAENNIPIVGKTEVYNNREMHWLRIDRYFKSHGDTVEAVQNDPNPKVVFQPVMCVHCENAPCEQVCPVAATTHDTEGLNVMVYNRCIGTRYCSNNCPYKVRRFNYYDYHSKDARGAKFPLPWLGMPDSQQPTTMHPVKSMVFNPEVSLRMRGVMEKCTYCVQRIHHAKVNAKNEWHKGQRKTEFVRDGEIVTACQQSCPTNSIIFGDLNERAGSEASAVVKLHQSPRAYPLLEELNTRPRTKHLARVRNLNASLEAVKASEA